MFPRLTLTKTQLDALDDQDIPYAIWDMGSLEYQMEQDRVTICFDSDIDRIAALELLGLSRESVRK